MQGAVDIGIRRARGDENKGVVSSRRVTKKANFIDYSRRINVIT